MTPSPPFTVHSNSASTGSTLPPSMAWDTRRRKWSAVLSELARSATLCLATAEPAGNGQDLRSRSPFLAHRGARAPTVFPAFGRLRGPMQREESVMSHENVLACGALNFCRECSRRIAGGRRSNKLRRADDLSQEMPVQVCLQRWRQARERIPTQLHGRPIPCEADAPSWPPCNPHS